MSDSTEAFLQRLRAIFADEAREHLQRVAAGLLALEQAAPGAQAGELGAILKTLHTLKGAARSVDLTELERLCHALEGVCSAAAESGGALASADLDLLHQAAALARELIDAPNGRTRNQAAGLGGALERMAARLADGHAAGEGGHSAGGNGTDPPAPVAPATLQGPAAQASPAPGLVRLQAAQLDAIRAEGEALLAAELGLRHQLNALRALAAEMGAGRRHREPQETRYELRCAQVAQQLDAACTALGAVRQRLMDAILDTSLVPFAAALDELPTLVRNLGRSRGSEVRLETAGESVQVDRRVVGVLREVLVHLVSNAVDHGIEPPDARRAAGKDPVGTVRVSAEQRERGQLLVRVADDGAGLDAAGLAAAAQRQGALAGAELERLDERQRLELALRAGVSTRTMVTTVSGRGMGLAIVADKVAAAGGSLAIDSTPGRGCAFELLVPVSLANVRALLVEAGGLRQAVPLAGLDRVRKVEEADIATVGGRETLVDGGRVLPVVRLTQLFGGAQSGGPGVALIGGVGARSFALLGDAIVAEQDVLPKGLGRLLRRVRYVSGAAQLGDGSLVPVVALDDIAAHALAAPQPAAAPLAAGAGGARARRVLVVEDSITSRLLLKHILEGAGCEVETAVDGLDALSKLRLAEFDAVVSDVEMPQCDGLALTARIRATPQTAELPVILVTSLQTPAERERGLQAGADAYLTKGAFDQDALLGALRRLA